MVVTVHTAEALTAGDAAALSCGVVVHGSDELVAKPLVIAFGVMSTVRRGLFGPRRPVPSYCCATNRRYQRSRVSGVTMVSSPRSALRPSFFAAAASRLR